MPSLKKNVVYSSILTTANYIFPLITYPYVSRVLGVTNIGICNFVDSIINYYCLFAMMGIGTVAIREVARVKGDKEQLSKAFSSLLLLNLLTTVVMIAALILSIILIPKFAEYRQLMYVGVAKLLFNVLLIEWLYKGLEDFKYITIRSIFVRLAYVILVFVFVRKPSDYPIYYALIVITVVFNAIINISYSRKHVSLTFKGVSFKPYWKSVVVLGVYQLLTSLYTTFNVAYLGFVANDTEVGYYTTATKLHGIILALFSAFTSVMLPRMSALVAEGKKEAFEGLFHKSIDILFAFAVPMVCLCMVFADQMVRWVSGMGYEQAVPCMQIVMPLVFVIGYEQILVIQILMPLKKDRSILVNSIVGAIVGVVANVLLVPWLSSAGSSVVWIVSELSVLLMAQMFVRKYTRLQFPISQLAKYLWVYVPLIALLLGVHLWNPLNDFTIVVALVITLVYCTIVESYVFKNDIVVGMLKSIVVK